MLINTKQWPHYGQQALVNIGAAKIRSLLAVLGVLVGSAAVVALLHCGKLATEKALQQFQALGTDLLAVSVYPKSPTPTAGARSLSLPQWQPLQKSSPFIRSVSPYATLYQPMTYEGRSLQGIVIGAPPSLARTLDIGLASGYFPPALASLERFCVIGHDLARQMKTYSLDSPKGKTLRIGSVVYTIVGIAAPWKENAFFNENINQAVIVPLEGVAVLSKDIIINNAVLKLKPDSPITEVSDSISNYLHNQAPELGLFLRSAQQIIDSMESQSRIFTILLAVIGGIALVVGGIGVMNVMLVSVSERKKEIGIRKAIGAKNYDIQSLFLMESLLLSLLGGGLGVVLGLGFTFVLAYFSDWPFRVYMLPVVVGFMVSAAVGVFFGFYPARRAAGVDPVESLRS